MNDFTEEFTHFESGREKARIRKSVCHEKGGREDEGNRERERERERVKRGLKYGIT